MADEHEQTPQPEAGPNVANQHDGQSDRQSAGQRFSHQGDSWADKYRSRFVSGARRRFSATGGPPVALRDDDQLSRDLSLRGRGAEDYERWDDRLKEMHKQLRIAHSKAREKDGDEGWRAFPVDRPGNGGPKPGRR